MVVPRCLLRCCIAWEHLPNVSLARLSNAARDSLAAYPADWPDLQYIPIDLGPIIAGDTGNYLTVAVSVKKTTAHGTVSISSTDTNINPLVNVNWLGSTIDQEVAVEGLRRARDLIAAIGLKAGPEVIPGDNITSYDQILEYLKNKAIPAHHPAGTCEFYSFSFSSCGKILTQSFK
jgi:choline dehydrogenase